MFRRFRHTGAWLLVYAALCGAPALAQGSGSELTGLKSVGPVIVDGNTLPNATPIFVNLDIKTEAQLSGGLIGKGNSLEFAPNSTWNFFQTKNAFILKSGGSKVASYTGMSARLRGTSCYYWVSPVDSNLMTLYEVNWSGSSAWVYARSYDVYIRLRKNQDATNVEDDHRWLVKAGQMARIPDVQLCRPIVAIFPQPLYEPWMGATAAAAAIATPPIIWAIEKPSMSGEAP